MYKFELTEDQTNLILEGLGELPAKKSWWLIGTIRQQAQEQDAAAERKKPEGEQKEPAAGSPPEVAERPKSLIPE